MKPIWIVDDDQSIRFVLQKALEKADLPVRSFASTREVQAALATEQPQVLVSDIRMPGGSGIALLQELKRSQPQLPVIIMTAYSDLDSAVSAFQSGAFEYLSKPFDVDKAVDLIRRAVDESLREQGAETSGVETPELLGQAPAMQDVFRAIGRLSPSLVTVLITGESGSGKELVAQALHRHSPRAQGPFVAINTAAIPRDLLESELFGHERGAFTGAQSARRGRFEQAEAGTLFLDEIGDMPYELQTRLLRALQEREVERIGGSQAVKVDVRVVAATNLNLKREVEAGRFREDLYFRLNVLPVRVPPLRERREDIPVFMNHLLRQFTQREGRRVTGFTARAIDAMMAYDWPGNIRELENLVERGVVLASDDGAIDIGHLFLGDERLDAEWLGLRNDGALRNHLPGGPDLARAAQAQSLGERVQALLSGHPGQAALPLDQLEAELVRSALTATAGNQSAAARLLGISRAQLIYRLKRLAV